MTTTDEAFLAEVDAFLTACNPPILPSSILTPSDNSSDDNRNDPADLPRTIAKFEKISGRVVGTVPLPVVRSRRLKTVSTEDAAAKRELEKAKDRKRRRVYRERRRIEREELQQEVERLTEELKEAQGHDDLLTVAWKLLAERQLAARMAAEEEQRRLCTSINTQIALLEGFRTSMIDRLSNLVNMPTTEHDAIAEEFGVDKRVRQEPCDDEIFVAYIQELDGIYSQTDETLLAGGYSTEPNWGDVSEDWIKDPNTGYFKYRGKLTLPFDYREICRSRWFTAPLHHRQESRQLYKSVDDPDNTLAFKFRITTRLSSGKIASVLQRIVIRRYEEKERMVIVWRLFTEGEGAFNGMYADETGWSVAIPVENSATTGTVMITCVRNLPMHLNNVAKRQPTMKQFADKLVEWGSENNSEVLNTLQNLVLE